MADKLPAVPVKPASKQQHQHHLGATAMSSSKGRSASGQSARAKNHRQLDVIDKLDVSGLSLDMAFHHSGPFDAARSKGSGSNGKPTPIGAFSSSAFDPAKAMVAKNGADLAPLRDSHVPSSRYGNNGTQNGSGISARARAAMNASFQQQDPTASLENLMPLSPSSISTGNTSRGHSRRSSDSSIILGFPANSEKLSVHERQYAEAFGVHNEAYQDYGTSGWARKHPRASMLSTEPSTLSVLGVPGSGLSREARADRTASIWDIEATLRAGRPVGAGSVPPPMPSIPDRYLCAPAAANEAPALPDKQPETSSPASQMKRNRSLINRMRNRNGNKDDSAILQSRAFSPNPEQESPSAIRKIYSRGDAATAGSPIRSHFVTPAHSAHPSLSSTATTQMLTRPSMDRQATSSSALSQDRLPKLDLRPVDTQMFVTESSQISPTSRSPYFASSSLRQYDSKHGKNGSSDEESKSSLSRSQKYGNLAYESATALVLLTESDSKDSTLSGNTTGSSAYSNDPRNPALDMTPQHSESMNLSASSPWNNSQSYNTPDTSFGSGHVYLGSVNDSSPNGHPANKSLSPSTSAEKSVKRKPSLARRLLGGKSKRQ